MKEKMLDSNVFIHAFLEPKENINTREAEIKQKSMQIVNRIQQGRLKVLMTTAQIFEISNILESWLGHEVSKEIVDFIVTASNIKIYTVSQKDLEDALVVVEQYNYNKIGFNDCITYIAMKNTNTSEILSFDKHFDTLAGITRLEE